MKRLLLSTSSRNFAKYGTFTKK